MLAVDGLTWRELHRSDAAELLEIELAAEAAEPSEHSIDLAEVHEQLADPGLRLSDGSVGVFQGSRLVGFGVLVVNPPVDTWAAMLHTVVLPDVRHRGIGREVVRRLLARAAAIHAAEHADLPAQVRVWLAQGRDTAAAFAQQAGFTPQRFFTEMRVDLRSVTLPAPEPLPGMEIRRWTPADDDATRLAYNASFADHWGSTPASPERWRNLFADSSNFRPDFSRLAVQNGEVVGFVLSDEFDSETAARGHRTGYLDRVGTVRSVRGRGVASALLLHCLHAMRESGCAYAELAVDADSPTGAGRLYQRLGFVEHRRNEVWAVGVRPLG